MKETEELEVYRFIPDGHKDLALAYDTKTRLYIKKYDGGLIKLVKYSDIEKWVEKLKNEKNRKS